MLYCSTDNLLSTIYSWNLFLKKITKNNRLPDANTTLCKKKQTKKHKIICDSFFNYFFIIWHCQQSTDASVLWCGMRVCERRLSFVSFLCFDIYRRLHFKWLLNNYFRNRLLPICSVIHYVTTVNILQIRVFFKPISSGFDRSTQRLCSGKYRRFIKCYHFIRSNLSITSGLLNLF